MVTEIAAEAVGLCLAPAQTLGNVKKLVMGLKKTKISLRKKYPQHHFHWNSQDLRQLLPLENLLPGGACLHSTLVPQNVCVEEQPERVWWEPLCSPSWGAAPAFHWGVICLPSHLWPRSLNPEHPLHSWFSLWNQTRASTESMKPFPAVFAPACRWVRVLWGVLSRAQQSHSCCTGQAQFCWDAQYCGELLCSSQFYIRVPATRGINTPWHKLHVHCWPRLPAITGTYLIYTYFTYKDISSIGEAALFQKKIHIEQLDNADCFLQAEIPSYWENLVLLSEFFSLFVLELICFLLIKRKTLWNQQKWFTV